MANRVVYITHINCQSFDCRKSMWTCIVMETISHTELSILALSPYLYTRGDHCEGDCYKEWSILYVRNDKKYMSSLYEVIKKIPNQLCNEYLMFQFQWNSIYFIYIQINNACVASLLYNKFVKALSVKHNNFVLNIFSVLL